MPSLGHVAVGLAAGKLHSGARGPRLASTMVLTALATFPDLDVVARRLGAVRGSVWLHRGALHSLAVAAAVALATALLVGGLGQSRWRMAVTSFLVAASHGILDAFTSGGAGIMLLWPLESTRWLAPWLVVPAAPMGLRLMSARGVEVLLREAILFSPLIAYALWPASRARRCAPAPLRSSGTRAAPS